VRTTIGIAIDIPEPWGSQLTRRRLEAGDAAAAHIPAHLTLLGPTEVDTGVIAEVAEHLTGVARGQEPFPVHLSGTGTFRPLTEVVFVAVVSGVDDCRRLWAAIRELDTVRRDLRFEYHPHVTVAHDIAPDALDLVFDDLADFDAKFTVAGFTLFEHGPDGRWRPQREYLLGGGAAPPPASHRRR
jgi:2'-5' RNA ligase